MQHYVVAQHNQGVCSIPQCSRGGTERCVYVSRLRVRGELGDVNDERRVVTVPAKQRVSQMARGVLLLVASAVRWKAQLECKNMHHAYAGSLEWLRQESDRGGRCVLLVSLTVQMRAPAEWLATEEDGHGRRRVSTRRLGAVHV